MDITELIQILAASVMPHVRYAALLQPIVQVVLKDIIYQGPLAHFVIVLALIVHLLYVNLALLDFIIKMEQRALNVISQIVMLLKTVIHVLMVIIMMPELVNSACQHV